MQFLSEELFQNLCSIETKTTLHDLARLGSVSWKLPFGGLWIFYGKYCLANGINLLHELNDTFVMKLKYGGKQKVNIEGKKKWIVKTPIIMTQANEISH